METLKKILRFLSWVLLILLALSGMFFAFAPRRPEQDYDNEIKTELVEGNEDSIEASEKT